MDNLAIARFLASCFAVGAVIGAALTVLKEIRHG